MNGLDINKTDEYRISISAAATEDNVEAVIRTVDDFVREHNCPDFTRRNLNTIIDDACINIVDYAYDAKAVAAGENIMKLDCEAGSGFIRIRFIDRGIKFNPLQIEQPADADVPQLGGLGIHLIRNMADDVAYEYHDGCNILTVELNWKAQE